MKLQAFVYIKIMIDVNENAAKFSSNKKDQIAYNLKRKAANILIVDQII